jgi:RNA polymerase sigma-70 factor (ECF subfamily)
VGAWLRGIAFHLFSAVRRREGRRATVALELEPAAPPIEDSVDEERRAALVRAFARLSGPHQTVLRMHYLEASSSREVAALLGVTPKAVEGRLYQARKALRTLAMGEDLREEAKA